MDQEEAFTILTFGHSVFLTGPAGSGKTYVLNQYLDWLKEQDVPVAVTATTGIAATHIGGQTIHSWSGLGITADIGEWDLEALEQRKSLYERVNSVSVLVIDEISMLSAQQLDSIDRILRRLRRTQVPFGGVQVVFVGDFFQLPPVSRGGSAQFAFEAASWQAVKPVVCYLETNYRQEDKELTGVLGGIREGGDLKSNQKILETRLDKTAQGETTKLFTHNADVDVVNDDALSKLSGKSQTYLMTSKGSKLRVGELKKGCLAPEKLVLKRGAKVMFVKNDPAGEFVNGTMGEVKGIRADRVTVRCLNGHDVTVGQMSWGRYEEGVVVAEIKQVPLRLAWAITVHKSQGMTLDAAQIDLSKTFEKGQGYVALSRVRSLEKLYLTGLNPIALEIDQRVRQAEKHFKTRSEMAQAKLSKLSDTEKEMFTAQFTERATR